MPPERFPPDDPREWLNRARSSLALAKTHLPEAYLEDLCFQAHQAAEKAIKALLIKQGVVFPYVHDLARLLTILEEVGEPIPETIRNWDDSSSTPGSLKALIPLTSRMPRRCWMG